MSDPYLGEIRLFGGTFAPVGWMFCDGTQLSIAENDRLFQLIGTTYGGDGESTFNLPDLRGRVPIHQGTNPSTGTSFTLAGQAGVGGVALTTQQRPQNNHFLPETKANGAHGQTRGHPPAQNRSASAPHPRDPR